MVSDFDATTQLTDLDLNKVENFAKDKKTSVLVILFEDMKGSAILKQGMTEQLSEDASLRAWKEHDGLLKEIITRDGSGEIIKSTGDGLLAVFSEPSTAVDRAIEVQERLHGHPYIRVRIGIDMGQVRVESSGGVEKNKDLFGRHVDWAARAEALAEGGHICCTRSVYIDAFGWLSKTKIAWKEHGAYRVKPGEPPLEVYEPYNANITRPMTHLRGEKIAKEVTTPGIILRIKDAIGIYKEDISRRGIPLSIGLAGSLSVIVLSIIFSDLFSAWEAKSLDYRFRLRGNISTDPGIVLIDCDDKSIAKIGRWPWDRSWHARMIDILSQGGAKAIGYDILFRQPVDKSSDDALISATKKGEVYYPVGFELAKEEGPQDEDTEGMKRFGYKNQAIESGGLLKVRRSLAPFPSLSDISKGIGHISSNRDQDGVIRRVPLVVDLDGMPFPSFGLQVIAGYLDVTSDNISIYPGKEIILNNARISGGRRGAIRIPIDHQGMMIINYAGRWSIPLITIHS